MAKRKRASRGSLSPKAIIDAALKISDEEGLDRLTVRRLATVLGVAPMSIYGHFQNKDEILSELLGRVIEEFEVTSHKVDSGKEWITESFKRMRRALLAHPGVIPLLGTGSSVSEQSIKVMEALVLAFSEMGMSPAESAKQFYAMVTFTIGTAHVENGFKQILAQSMPEQVASRFGEMAPSSYVTLLEMAPHLAQQSNEEVFEGNLRKLLAIT